MFREGFKAGKNLSLKERRSFFLGLKYVKSSMDVKKLVEKYVDLPAFKSVVDEYEYLLGFLSGVSYFTKTNLQKDLREYIELLNLKDIPNLWDYYISANRYFDRSYGKERIVVTLRPKKGSLAKGKTRVPKIKDYNRLKKVVGDFKDLLEIYRYIEYRKYRYFVDMV